MCLLNPEIEHVESLKYLGSIVSQDGGTDQDINQRIRKGDTAFIQLYQVWKNKNFLNKIKLLIFITNVKSDLIYARETWEILKTSMNILQKFVNRCLRRVLNIRWPDTISDRGWRKLHNEELHNMCSSPSIIRMIKSRRIRWVGHVTQMGEKRDAYRILVGEPEGKRPLGRPRRRWVCNIKMHLREI
ncbi:hypothetical protein B7P43_G09203 [Cryptotermes secundus]|uniref:Reverse transcriptase domain-containing protein n=1 Tax=Cryptotermes secundus TaxID=105785 RepID=A0A2J7QGW6_9NEOP|nr:hypothetical protein B7P43_G09203 [Cryptotermes secundus]